MGKKRCIFHIPDYVDPLGMSGSSVRPNNMIKAFVNLGYEVAVITGYGNCRAEQIKLVKNRIINGVKYDFLYAESSTMPTLLTEKNHVPKYPFLDYSFFKFCRKSGIKIGLFYRDIYWKFPAYKNSVSFLKRCISIPMYKYDLHMYKKLINVFYVASSKVKIYLPKSFRNLYVDTLPPGAEYNHNFLDDSENHFNNLNKDNLVIFYVGGISKEYYDLTEMLKALYSRTNVCLYLCCREKEWEIEYCRYDKFLTDRIKVIHESGKNLLEYYNIADVTSIVLNPSEYRNMAMPIKLFEYLSHTVPVLITSESVAADFVYKTGWGFCIKNDSKDIGDVLDQIVRDKGILKCKHDIAKKILYENTWERRAQKVVNDLT